jgi:hypothetical protein
VQAYTLTDRVTDTVYSVKLHVLWCNDKASGDKLYLMSVGLCDCAWALTLKLVLCHGDGAELAHSLM